MLAIAVRHPKPYTFETGTRNLKPKIRNPKSGIRNPESDTRNSDPGTRNPETLHHFQPTESPEMSVFHPKKQPCTKPRNDLAHASITRDFPGTNPGHFR